MLRSYATAARSAFGYEIPIADHFGDWRLWCEDDGHKPGSVQTFGRDLRAVIPTLKVTRPRADDDSRGYELDVAYRRGIGTVQVPNRGPMMSDKSPRKSMSKKSGKSLKEKRADKKAKSSEHTVIETAFHAKKR